MLRQPEAAAKVREIPLCAPWLGEAQANAVRDQVFTGWVGPGRTTAEFASAIASLAGMPFAVPTCSGTVALSVAAAALGLRPGDEILVPAYGVVSTINAFAFIGLKPKLVDIERSTACMSPEQLRRRIGPETRAVCFVDFSGHTGASLVETARICRQAGIPLIEDAACAFGQRFQGKAAGSFGTMGTYSFSVPKIVTTGQGGALVMTSREHHDQVVRIIDQGDTEWRKTNLNRSIGSNLRFNDVLAALGLSQMENLEARRLRKRAAYETMRERLATALFSLEGSDAPLHNIVLVERRDDLVAFLSNRGISAQVQYRTLSEHPPYAHLAGDFPNADLWSRHAVYLPFGLSLTPEEGVRIADAVLESRVPLLPF